VNFNWVLGPPASSILLDLGYCKQPTETTIP
jgi:hypothetical protein